MTWTSYFHQLQSQWQVAKLQNPPENPVKAKQVVKAFFISQGTRGNKWRLLLSSIPNSPLLSGWNRPGKKMSLYLTSIPDIVPWLFTLPTGNFFLSSFSQFFSAGTKFYHLNVINCVRVKSDLNINKCIDWGNQKPVFSKSLDVFAGNFKYCQQTNLSRF